MVSYKALNTTANITIFFETTKFIMVHKVKKVVSIKMKTRCWIINSGTNDLYSILSCFQFVTFNLIIF